MNNEAIAKSHDEVFYAGLAAIGLSLGGSVFVLAGIAGNGAGAFLWGGFLFLISAILVYFIWFAPIDDAFFIAISQARWCPDAKTRLVELVEQYGDKIRYKHVREIEAIQRNYEFSLEATSRKNARKTALESLRR